MSIKIGEWAHFRMDPWIQVAAIRAQHYKILDGYNVTRYQWDNNEQYQISIFKRLDIL